MLKSIARLSPELLTFINALHHPLNKPQTQHVARVVDSLIVSEGKKTLSGLYRHIVGDVCPKAGADSFRVSPWTGDELRIPLRQKLFEEAFKQRQKSLASPLIFLSIDDSLTEKDRHSKRLQAVDWHFDHTRALPGQVAYQKGFVYVMLRLTVGEVSFTVDMQLYLRASTIRRLNKARKPAERLTFRSKIDIARDMLEGVLPLLPAGYKVYVLFDSWYAASALMKWCWEQDWYIICRLKSNRLLDGLQVRLHNTQRLKHRRYTRVRVTAADEERPTKTYLVRSLTGKLSSLSDEVRVFISKRHSRDTRPRYFCSTDPSLSAHQALNYYHERWACEVANWYITEKLGWADCRLWHVESVEKYLVVLWLALAYLEVRRAQTTARNLAEVIRLHRQAHARALLEEACTLVLDTGNLKQVFARYSLQAT